MTVALVANIALPISSALSTAFSTDAVGKMDAYGKIGASSPAWSPLSLFANDEEGVWFDPSDLSTMFQDSAGTTPVTADGQPVGKILDKSGRGNHASQATAAARPLYKTDGTYHWLQFDGVDDSLSTAAIDFTGTDKMSVFSGIRKQSDANAQIVLELGAGVGAAGTFLNRSPYAYGLSGVTWNLRGTSDSYYLNTGLAAPATFTNSAMMNIGKATLAEELIPRINGVITQDGSSGTTAGTGNFSNNALYIGSRVGNIQPTNGNIYSLIVRGALSTAQQITDAEAWVNSKTGAY